MRESDETSASAGARCGAPSLLFRIRGHLRGHSRLRLLELRRERFTKIRRFEYPANLDLGLPVKGIGAPLDSLDRLFLRLHLKHPEASNQPLGVREGAIHYGSFLARKLDARSL